MKINGITLDKSINLPLQLYIPKDGSYWTPYVAFKAFNQSNVANGINTLNAYPFLVTEPIQISEVISRIVGTSAATTYRIGIYDDDGNAYPRKLIPFSDTGTYSSATAGIKTGTFSNIIKLPIGLYWIVFNSSSATPTLRTALSASYVNVLGWNSTMSAKNVGWTVAYTYGAMPDAFPLGGTLHTRNTPVYAFKVVG